mgnify:CR=1 FL=1
MERCTCGESDRVLAAMKRGHTAAQYVAKINALRAIRPNLSLSSDFIVGFPGETEEDFAATMALIEEVGFDVSFSFIYSARPGTPAAALVDDTPEAVKKQRLQHLQATLRNQADAIADAMVGTQQRLLVTGFAKKDPEWHWSDIRIPVVMISKGNGARLHNMMDLDQMHMPEYGGIQFYDMHLNE